MVLNLIASIGCGAIEDLDPAPMITITSPTERSPVSGTVTITSEVQDPGGDVASVAFDLPGARIIDAVPPFTTAWDTTAVADGSYLIQATVVDVDGATGTTSRMITVTNTRCLEDRFLASIPRPLRIPDASDRGVSSSIAVVGRGAIASLWLSVTVSHPFPPDLLVTLTSPAGTGFIVSDPDHPEILNPLLPITAFQGEPAAGTWTLSVHDVVPGDTGTLDAWSIAILGRCAPATR